MSFEEAQKLARFVGKLETPLGACLAWLNHDFPDFEWTKAETLPRVPGMTTIAMKPKQAEPVDDGGPAYPHWSNLEDEKMYPGISVRMWLAGQALSGIYAGWPPNIADFDHPVAAENALEAADALIAESKKGG